MKRVARVTRMHRQAPALTAGSQRQYLAQVLYIRLLQCNNSAGGGTEAFVTSFQSRLGRAEICNDKHVKVVGDYTHLQRCDERYDNR